ncbi:MAG TPA: response regulator [Candidatus Moranbacteria bacterium]|nr:response regulator [Candidatus Moranbacteria bacterium]
MAQRIMVVEDDSFVMDIYQTKLTQEGYEVISASNGIEAIKKLEENKKPELILLDIIMPYMDGLEVLRKIKNNKNWKKIPIILLTNLSQKEEVQEGLKLGAKDYLIKSHFTPSEVLEKIKIALK